MYLCVKPDRSGELCTRASLNQAGTLSSSLKFSCICAIVSLCDCKFVYLRLCICVYSLVEAANLNQAVTLSLSLKFICICVIVFLCDCVFVYLCVYPYRSGKLCTRASLNQAVTLLLSLKFICICVILSLCLFVFVYLYLCICVYSPIEAANSVQGRV